METNQVVKGNEWPSHLLPLLVAQCRAGCLVQQHHVCMDKQKTPAGRLHLVTKGSVLDPDALHDPSFRAYEGSTQSRSIPGACPAHKHKLHDLHPLALMAHSPLAHIRAAHRVRSLRPQCKPGQGNAGMAWPYAGRGEAECNMQPDARCCSGQYTQLQGGRRSIRKGTAPSKQSHCCVVALELWDCA